MNKWQDIWDIQPFEEQITRMDGTTFEKTSWYIVDKVTGEKQLTKTRTWGYSDRTAAMNGASHKFRQITKALEKELLGKA